MVRDDADQLPVEAAWWRDTASTCGLYVHVPFCETKCGYCDFYSVPLLEGRETGPLVRCVVSELRSRKRSASGAIRTIFVGGGTPTLLPLGDLRCLFDALGEVASGGEVSEFTVEANPATIDDAKLSVLTGAGVDRLSMGAQSWSVDELAQLERLHSPDDIAPGVLMARRHGIRRINLDLIFGIPGQTLASWSNSLDRTIALCVDHISCYGLTYEAGTRLTAQMGAGRVTRCDEELEADMYTHAIDRLAAAGYEQYEISNFARLGERCAHNVAYWRNDPYIGVGPSAAGYLNGERYKNVADIGRYVAGIEERGEAVLTRERVSGVALAGETIMMQLRQMEGLNVGRFTRQTGIDALSALAPELSRFSESGLLTVDRERIALTRAGFLVADGIISELYAALGESGRGDGSAGGGRAIR